MLVAERVYIMEEDCSREDACEKDEGEGEEERTNVCSREDACEKDEGGEEGRTNVRSREDACEKDEGDLRHAVSNKNTGL